MLVLARTFWIWHQRHKQLKKKKKKKQKQVGIKFKSICTVKETINKMKKAKLWKIFANHVLNKGLRAKIYKDIL